MARRTYRSYAGTYRNRYGLVVTTSGRAGGRLRKVARREPRSLEWYVARQQEQLLIDARLQALVVEQTQREVARLSALRRVRAA